jgi:hypothetical protein
MEVLTYEELWAHYRARAGEEPPRGICLSHEDEDRQLFAWPVRGRADEEEGG